MKKQILITRKIPDIAKKILLENDCEVEVFEEDRSPTAEEFARLLTGKDAVISLLNNSITAQVIDVGLPALKVISNYAAGYDNIDIEYAKKKSVIVTNTPGALTSSTAELTIALIFACARRIVESDKFTRAGKFRGWDPMLMLGSDISNATLGIIGFGKIGMAVARKMAGFEMNLLYYSRTHKRDFERLTGAKKVDLHTLLRNSDFVSIHLPASSETRHLITSNELAMMKSTAILINTGRGSIVKEEDLCDALARQVIASAGLDVYEFEPRIHEQLLKLDNAVLLPHIGSATVRTRNKMAEMAALNVVNVFSDKLPISRVV